MDNDLEFDNGEGARGKKTGHKRAVVYLGAYLGVAGIARVVRVIRGGGGANRRTEA